MKKSYYLENGNYFDITTGKEYTPQVYCDICGCHSRLTVHHYLSQNKCLRDLKIKRLNYPSIWNQEFINKNQQLFTLCVQCHTDVHNMSKENFYKKYHINKEYYIWNN